MEDNLETAELDAVYISSSLTTSHRTDQKTNEIEHFAFDFQAYTPSGNAKLETSIIDPYQISLQNLELQDCANAERNAFGTNFVEDTTAFVLKEMCKWRIKKKITL